MSYPESMQRDISLKFLAMTAKHDEQMAYALLNTDKEMAHALLNTDKEMAHQLIDRSIATKKFIKDNTDGIDQDYYLLLADATGEQQ